MTPLRDYWVCTLVVAGLAGLLLGLVGWLPAAFADVRISWTANPPEENVVEYEVDVSGATLSVTDTDALCSEFVPPIDCEDGQRYVGRVRAINEGGFRSDWSASVPFGPASAPVNVSVERQ